MYGTYEVSHENERGSYTSQEEKGGRNACTVEGTAQ
jgi:hypothetical protein